MRRLATTLSALGFLWVCAATVYLLDGAGYDGVSTTAALAGSEGDVGHVTVSLLSAQGPWVVGLLLGVTLMAGIPFGVALTHPEGQRGTTWSVGLLLLGFSIISGFSVGLPYVPGAVVLLGAALVSPAHHGPGSSFGVDHTSAR